MHVKLNLLTPLWTGDATKEAHHIEGAGLAGSLRWWYEIIVRGLGGWTCDPTSDDRCPAGDSVTVDNVTEVLCPACQVFGATGWAKRFIMSVRGQTTGRQPWGLNQNHVQAERRNQRGQNPRYFFPPGQLGSVELTFLARNLADTTTLPLLLGVLEFARLNGALGAKTNLGYGIFQWQDNKLPQDLPAPVSFGQMMAEKAARSRHASTQRRPGLRDMFFAEVALSQPWRPQDFVNFKFDLRALYRQGQFTRELRHFLLGTVQENPNQASKIKMALLPGNHTLRLWGWVPDILPGAQARTNRDAVVSLIYEQARRVGHISRWREFNSARDSQQRFAPGQETEYLHSLMEVNP